MTVNQWGGLNTFTESGKIPDYDGQQAENVLTDAGRLETPPGNVRFQTILAGNAAKSVHEFIGPDAVKYGIFHSSQTVYFVTPTSGAVSIATMSSTEDIDAVNGFNRVFVVNGLDTPFSWNASAVSYPTLMPICNLIEFKDERLWCALGGTGSEVVISSYGGFNSAWTLVNDQDADDPTNLLFNQNDGESITCLKKTPWGMYVGKRSSSYIVKGNNTLDYYLRTIDPKIGCVNDRGLQMLDGLLIIPALEGVYAWDGSASPKLITPEIENLYLAIRQLNAFDGSQLFTTQAQWESGTNDLNNNTTVWDTTTTPGSIQKRVFPSLGDTSTADFISGTLDQISTSALNIPSGSIGIARSSYGVLNLGFEIVTSTGYTTYDGYALFSAVNSTCIANNCAYLQLCGNLASWTSGSPGTNSWDELKIYDGDLDTVIYTTSNLNVQGFRDYEISLTTLTASRIYFRYKPSSILADSNNSLVSPLFGATTYFNYRKSVIDESTISNFCGGLPQDRFVPTFDTRDRTLYASSGTFTSRSFDTALTTVVYGPFLPNFSHTSSGTVNFYTQVSSNATDWVYRTNVSSEVKSSTASFRYWRYVTTMTSTDGTGTPLLNEVYTTFTSTGRYTSPVQFISSNVTTFSQLAFTQVSDPSGRAFFQVRGATYQFLTSDTNPSYFTQVNLATPSFAATTTYWQFRIESRVESPTETLRIDQSLLSWHEGITNPLASGTKEHRYFLSVATQTSSTQNDTVLVWQKNNKWTQFTGPSYYAMGDFDGNLMATDSSTSSYVWKTMQSGTLDYDGVVIKPLWVSKDFDLGIPFRWKNFPDGIWVEAERVAGSSVTVGYATNRAPFVEKTLDLAVSSTVINRRIDFTEGYLAGKSIRLKFSNDRAENRFKIFSYEVPTHVEETRHDPNE